MQISSIKGRREQGSSLLTVVVVGAILCISTCSMLVLSTSSINHAYSRVSWDKAFYCAENAMVWASQAAFDTGVAPGSTNYYSTSAGTLPLGSIVSSTNADPTFMGAWVTVAQPSSSASNLCVITASACVNYKVRTLQAQVAVRPVSQVFDYEYFLNNWGWWWGGNITGNGAQRANWDFDFRDSPTVNGLIYAEDQVNENFLPIQDYPGAPFEGTAGEDVTNMVHQGVPRMEMPNLFNLSNYMSIALASTNNNGIWIGTNQLVAGVLSNAYTPNPGGNAGNLSLQSGLYVVGTPAAPVVVKGTVIIPGDLVLQGTVSGQGTIYVGGNLYISGDITYANGPNFSALPETEAPAVRDAWVASSISNDLVAYAVRGSIFAGDVTSPWWMAYCYYFPGSGLAYVGDESHLGADGIANTPDDYTPFLHANGTTNTWFDADGDGIMEANYNYTNEIEMTTARAAAIVGYPTSSGVPVAYGSLASDHIGRLEGIFYTDHAVAMDLHHGNASLHGAVISRNEQIVFEDYLDLIYDSRVNSRYNNIPSEHINLGLPVGKPIQVTSFTELAPNATGLLPPTSL